MHFGDRLSNLNIKFLNDDYTKLNKYENRKNSFFYFDPPYYLGEATYNENSGWNEEKEKGLLEFIKNIDKNGNRFALSNVIEHRGMKNELLINWCKENNFKILYLKMP